MAKNEIKYLTAIKQEKPKKKFCRFKKYGIKYVDYKDIDFLKKFSSHLMSLKNSLNNATIWVIAHYC